MDAVDLEAVTAELYTLPPAEFTPRRTELAAQARKKGLKDLARTISELRRPTVAAWLINRLVQTDPAPGVIDELEQLGSHLRQAQAELDGDRLKELSKARQHLVASLLQQTQAAGSAAGQKVSPATLRELEETFGAAIADEQASLAVTSGRLTRALVYAGFGEVDVSAATAPATLGRSPRRAQPRPTAEPRPAAQPNTSTSTSTSTSTGTGTGTQPSTDARAAADAERAARQAAEALAVARSDEAAAIDDLAAADRHRQQVLATETRLTATLEELQHEIVRVRHELDGLTRARAAAERDHQRRQRQVDQARRAVLQATPPVP